MKITCENCNTRFVLDAARLPPQGARVRCSRCQHRFHVKPTPSAPTPDEIAEKVVQDTAPEGVAGPLEAGDDASLDNPEFLFDEPASPSAEEPPDEEDPPSRPLLGDPGQQPEQESHMLGEDSPALGEEAPALGDEPEPEAPPAATQDDALFGEAPATGYDEGEPMETPSLAAPPPPAEAPPAAPAAAAEAEVPPLEGLTDNFAGGLEEPSGLGDDFSLADSSEWDDVAADTGDAEPEAWRGFAREEMGSLDEPSLEAHAATPASAPRTGEPVREPPAWSALPELGSRLAAVVIGLVIVAAGVRAVPWHGLEALPGPATVRGAGWIATDIEAFHARGSGGARVLVVRGSLARDPAEPGAGAGSPPPRVVGQLARADGELVGRPFAAHAQRIEPLTPRTLEAWLAAQPAAPVAGAPAPGFTLLIPNESVDADRFRLELLGATARP